MSRTTIKDLEAQLSSANHELELATFLNKGILQTNTEYKLRIVELESENAVLRKAESRLAKTEDKLELAEKEVKKMQKEREGWEVDMQRGLQVREEAEKEREKWEEKYEKLRERLEGVVNDELAMDRTQSVIPTSTLSGPSRVAAATALRTASPSRPKATPQSQSKRKPGRLTQAHPQPITPSNSSTSTSAALAMLSANNKPSSSPVRPPPRAQPKKRRRVEDSTSDDGSMVGSDPLGNEEGYDQESEISPSPPPPTSSARRQPQSQSYSNKRSQALSHRSAVPAPQVTPTASGSKRRTRPEVMKVKAEPISPGGRYNDGEESDEDPLAMM